MSPTPPADESRPDGLHGDGSEPPRSNPRRRRRATTPPPDGSDPHPAPEPSRHSGTENDERMRREKPPHY